MFLRQDKAETGMRFNISGLQMAKQRFYNIETDKAVVFQSAIHVADQKFYDKVLMDMRLFKGEVHLEGIRNAGAYPKMRTLHELYSIMKEFLGDLETQTTRFPSLLEENPDKYKNYDVEASQVAEIFETEDMAKVFDKIQKMNLQDLENSKKKHSLNISPLMSLALLYGSNGKRSNSILENKKVVEERNEYAVEKVLESTSRNVYMFWGAMHYPGVKQLLMENGYKHIHTSYLTAVKNRVAVSPYDKNAVVEHFARIKFLLNADSSTGLVSDDSAKTASDEIVSDSE